MVQKDMSSRIGDQVPGMGWLRSHRVFFLNDGWYFQTSEAGNVGPFHSQVEADSYLSQVIAFLKLKDGSTKKLFLKTLAA